MTIERPDLKLPADFPEECWQSLLKVIRAKDIRLAVAEKLLKRTIAAVDREGWEPGGESVENVVEDISWYFEEKKIEKEMKQ